MYFPDWAALSLASHTRAWASTVSPHCPSRRRTTNWGCPLQLLMSRIGKLIRNLKKKCHGLVVHTFVVLRVPVKHIRVDWLMGQLIIPVVSDRTQELHLRNRMSAISFIKLYWGKLAAYSTSWYGYWDLDLYCNSSSRSAHRNIPGIYLTDRKQKGMCVQSHVCNSYHTRFPTTYPPQRCEYSWTGRDWWAREEVHSWKRFVRYGLDTTIVTDSATLE